MTAFRLDVVAGNSPTVCGHVGGSFHLPESTDWPRCGICNAEMVGFLQLELPRNDSTSFQPGSRLQVFACREHDDIAGSVYSDYTAFHGASRNRKLPAEYWNITDGHYLLRLLPPSLKTIQAKQESRLMRQILAATKIENDSADGFKMFGEPYWLQDAEYHQCSCGAPMQLLLQIPAGQGFPMAGGADKQPNSFSPTEYCLFLGNQLYLLGCTAQCNVHALWPVLQS